MKNDIIGEQLKGLYTAISALAGSHFLEVKTEAEFTYLESTLVQSFERITSLESELKTTLESRDELKSDLIEAVESRDEMKQDRHRISKQAGEKVNWLQTRLQQVEEERDKLRDEEQKYEKRFKDLTDEYEKLRTRMHQYRARRRQFGEVEEKMCRLCQRVYIERENFQWSCKIHTGEFGAEMWWCCGKSGRDAPGCKAGKHEPKDESEGLAQDKEELASVLCSVSTTQSCREMGHKAVDCPKDPNLRSKFDIGKEIDRVDAMHKQRKSALSSGVLASQALSLLGEKSQMQDFHHVTIATSPINSDLYDSDEEESLEEDRNAFFSDIRKLRREALPSHRDV